MSAFRRRYLSGVKEPLFPVCSADARGTPNCAVSFFLKRGSTSFFATMEGGAPKVFCHYKDEGMASVPVAEQKDKIAMIVPLSGIDAPRLLVVLNSGAICLLGFGRQSWKKLQTEAAVRSGGVLWVIAGNMSSHLFYQNSYSGMHVHAIEANGEDREICTWKSPANDNGLITGIAVVTVNSQRLLVLAGGGSLFTTSYEEALTANPRFTDHTRVVVPDGTQFEPALLIANDEYLVCISFVISIIPLRGQFPQPSHRVSLTKIEQILEIENPGFSLANRKMQPFLTERHLIMCSERHYVAISLETGKVVYLHTFHQEDKATCVSPPALPSSHFHFYIESPGGGVTRTQWKVLEVSSREFRMERGEPVLPLKQLNKMFIDQVRKGEDIESVSSAELWNMNYIILKLIQEGDYASAIRLLLSDSATSSLLDRNEMRTVEVLVSELQVLDIFHQSAMHDRRPTSKASQLDLLNDIISSLNVRALAVKPMDRFGVFTDAAQRSEDTGRNGIAYITQFVRMGQFDKAIGFISRYFDYYEYMLPSIAAKNPHEYVAAVMKLDNSRARLLRSVIPFVKGYVGSDTALSLFEAETDLQAAFDWLWLFCFSLNALDYEDRVCEQLRKKYPAGLKAFKPCADRMWFLIDALRDKGLSKIVAFFTTKVEKEKEVQPPSDGDAPEIISDITSILNDIGRLTNSSKAAVKVWLSQDSLIEHNQRPETKKPVTGDRSWVCNICQKHFFGSTQCIQMFCGHRFHESCLRREMYQLLPPEDRTPSKILSDCPLCGVIATRKLMSPPLPLKIFD